MIIGATSGIGRAVAHRLAGERRPLILAGRDFDELETTAADLRVRYDATVTVRAFEAGDFSAHAGFFNGCLAAAPTGLDGILVCHGYMPDQDEARRNFSEVRAMVEVNFLSAVSLLNLAADYFEQRLKGYICAISSVAGDRGRQSNYLYGSTKAALDSYLQGLRHRLHRSNVSVVTVKPGFVDTRMTWGLPGLFLVASPERVADDICQAVGTGRSIVYTPWFWGPIMRLIRSLPACLFHRTKL